MIDDDDLDLSVVSVGTHIKIVDEDGEAEEYDMTGSTEADPLNGKISDESPVGAALIGKKVGETAEVVLPNGGTVQYKILEIGRAAL